LGALAAWGVGETRTPHHYPAGDSFENLGVKDRGYGLRSRCVVWGILVDPIIIQWVTVLRICEALKLMWFKARQPKKTNRLQR